MCHPGSPRRRAGFTLVEALVVTAILAILFGLVTGAVMRGIITAEDTRVAVEIKQLENAITSFKTQFKVDYLPSSITLRTNLSSYPDNDPDWQFLTTMWPRLEKMKSGVPQFVDWAQVVNSPQQPPNRPNPAAAAFVLQGHQCLAFFLGGRRFDNQQAQNLGGYTGFSSNPTNPMAPPPPAGNEVPAGPFYEFAVERIVNNLRGAFPAYKDPYNPGQPYYYFSAYRGNYVNPGRTVPDMITVPLPNNRNGYVTAYRDWTVPGAQGQNGQFYNANRFQIFSAGRDGMLYAHAAGRPFFTEWRNGIYNPAIGNGMATNAKDGSDDLSNFHPNKLGIPK